MENEIAPRLCDKCGRDVPYTNCVLLFDLLDQTPDGHTLEFGLTELISNFRHLRPLEKDGKIVCEGSPSRCQYFGEKKDTRPEFKFNPELKERMIRALRLLELYGSILESYRQKGTNPPTISLTREPKIPRVRLLL